jgi:GT2 family glycosyltransferase
MELEPAVILEVVEQMRRGALAVVVPERSVGTTFWARVKAYEKSFYVGEQNVEAARFFLLAAFRGLRGFDESLDAGEDWDLTIRARNAGYPIGRTTASIIHHEGALGFWQSCRKKASYADGLRVFAEKHGSGALRNTLSRPYLSHPTLLMRRPLLGCGLCLLKSGEFAAVTASLTVGWTKRHLPSPVPRH